MKKISLPLSLLCLWFLSSTLVFSQTDGDSQTIYLRVNVTNKFGRNVTGLKKEHFKVTEGKTEQEISYFNDREEPASVAVLMDISGSVTANEIQAAAKTALRFVQTANSKNDYLLVAFGSEIYPLADWGSTDKQIVEALNQAANFKRNPQNTKFHDACWFALEKLEKSRFQKKVLLIVSDGEDTDSDRTSAKVKEKLKASDISVYSISFMNSDTVKSFQGQAFLEELTEITGGKSFFPQTLFELNELVARIVALLESQYVIGYKPKATAEKDKWRSVEVKVENRAMPLKVLVREGYNAETGSP